MTERSNKYLKFIRTQPCCVCGITPSQAHHESLTGRGVSVKCSDYETMPLCHTCHALRHQVGKKSFAQAYGINYREIIEDMQKKYKQKVHIRQNEPYDFQLTAAGNISLYKTLCGIDATPWDKTIDVNATCKKCLEIYNERKAN